MSDGQKLKKPVGMHWKHRIRLGLGPVLARIGRLLGVSWTTMGRSRLGREVLLEQIRHFRHGEVLEPAEKPLDVVFHAMTGAAHTGNTIMILLASILQARGHGVRFVLCDQQLPVCEMTYSRQREQRSHLCAYCYGLGRKFLTRAGFEVLLASEMMDDVQESSGRWGEFVEAMALRYYQVGRLPEMPEVRADLAAIEHSAEIAAVVGRRLIEMRPDRVVLTHGMYTARGPARVLLNEAGIPVVSFGRGKTAGTWKFNWESDGAWWDVSAEWNRVRDVPLSEKQEARIDEYLQSRRSHARDVLVYNFGEEESLQESRKRLHLDPDKQTFVLFTNVLWDAASAQREIAFQNPIEWVMETIAWFAEHPEKQLVVKVHPAEVVIGTKQPFVSLIAERFPELPENVRVIEPQEKVNSWSIMRIADLGLVHTSTVGMELPLEGIPCAVVSRTHYRDKGFTIDVSSREEYFRMLENWDPSSVDREQMVTLAKRYAYLLFLRYQFPLPFAWPSTHRNLKTITVGDVREMFDHPSIRMFIEAFENQTDFLLPPTE